MGKRQYVVKGTTFEVDDRYEVKKGVGQGAYGLICAAKDTASDDQARQHSQSPVPTPPKSPHAPLSSIDPLPRGRAGAAGGHQEDQQCF